MELRALISKLIVWGTRTVELIQINKKEHAAGWSCARANRNTEREGAVGASGAQHRAISPKRYFTNGLSALSLDWHSEEEVKLAGADPTGRGPGLTCPGDPK